MTDDRNDREKPKDPNAVALGAKGGKARANKLTPERLSEIAKKGAQGKWVPRASKQGVLRVADIELSCFIVPNRDGTVRRLFSQSGMAVALGTTKGGGARIVTGDRVANFLAGQAIKPYVPAHLATIPDLVVRFRLPQGGVVANGYEATVLADICDVVLAARADGVLRSNQEKIAERCEVLVRAFAKVGIIALVDEATGYQADRARDELQKILEAYIVEEMRPWVRRFPTEFFKQLYKLHGWQFVEGNAKHPGVVGHFINEWIYKRLPGPVLPKLRELNPTDETGRRRHKHHQYLTVDTGLPHLDNQIGNVVTLMRSVNGDKALFERLLANAYPAPGEQMHLIVDDSEGSSSA